MKKKFMGAFALVCALLVSFAFFGCGESENGGVAGGGKVNGDTKPEDIISQRLTEEEWKAAFDDANFVNFTENGKVFVDLNGQLYGMPLITTRVDSDKEYTTSSLLGENNGYYTSIENGKRYNYTLDEVTKKWKRELFEPLYEGDNDIFIYWIFKDGFANFTYSEEEKAYVAATYPTDGYTILTEAPLINLKLKFVDGKLSYMEYSFDGENDLVGTTGAIGVLFYDYGTTSVTLPSLS